MRARKVGSRLNAKQRIVVVLMDLFLLVELTLCMFKGAQDPEYMASQFLRLYVPMLLVTVITARLFMRKFRKPAQDAEDEAATADA